MTSEQTKTATGPRHQLAHTQDVLTATTKPVPRRPDREPCSLCRDAVHVRNLYRSEGNEGTFCFGCIQKLKERAAQRERMERAERKPVPARLAVLRRRKA